MADLNSVLAQLKTQYPETFTEEDPFTGIDLQQSPLQSFNIEPDGKFDWDMSNVVNNLVSGFVEGFTTVPASEFTKARTNDPVNRIVNSIGSLMGFVGFIPGAGTLGKIGVSGLLKTVGLTKSAKLLSALPKSFQVTSIPMGIANLVTKKLQQTGAYASLDAIKFLSKGSLGRDILEGGLHLGIASAVGSAPIYDLTPQTFIDKRLEGFATGAIFGAGNRAIGNAFSRGGKLDLAPLFTGKSTEEILKMTDRTQITKLLGQGDLVNKGVRALSSGLIFGMPATLKDYPLELQVYDYLLNAYFGGREMSRGQREALNLSMPYKKAGRRDLLLRPEITFKDKWDTISPEAKQELDIQANIELHGTVNEYTSSAYATVLGVQNKLAAIDADLAAGKITGEYARNMSKDAIIEDQVMRDPENPELAVEKAKEVIYDEAVKKDELQRSVSNFASLIKDLESLTPEKLNDEYYKFAERSESVRESIANGTLSRRYLEPFEELSTKIAQQLGIEKKDVDTRVGIIEKINKLALQHLSKDKSIYDFEKAIKGTFKLKELPRDVRLELIHSYEYIKQSKERPTYVIDSSNENKVRLQDEYTKNSLKRGVSIEPRAPLDRPEFFDGTLGELKRYVDEAGKEIDIQEAVRNGNITHAEILEKVYEVEKSVIGGKKTDSNLLTGKFLVDEASTPDYLQDILRVPEVADSYKKGYADFVKQGGTQKIVYDRNFVNNVELLKRFNAPNYKGLPSIAIKVMLDKNFDFITSSSAFNKRLQVFDSHQLQAVQEVISRVMGKDKMSFRILNANNKSKLPNMMQNEGEDFWYNIEKTDAKGNKTVEKRKYEAHRDGGTWLSKKAYEAIAVSVGLDPKSTSMKGIGLYPGYDGLGGLVLKHAIHKAPAELDAIMAKDGIDAMMYDTTAKQSGLRNVTDWTFDGEKFTYHEKPNAKLQGLLERIDKLPEGTYDKEQLKDIVETLSSGQDITSKHIGDITDLRRIAKFLDLRLDTKLVDADGKPTLLFHGSPSLFATFKSEFLGQYTGANSAKEAFFAAKDLRTALNYRKRDLNAENQLGMLEGDNPEPDFAAEEAWANHQEMMAKDATDPERIAYEQQEKDRIVDEAEGTKKSFYIEWRDNQRDERVTFEESSNVYPLMFRSQNPLILDVKGNRKNIGSFTEVLQKAKTDGYDAVVFKNVADGAKLTDVYTTFRSEDIVNVIDLINSQKSILIPTESKYEVPWDMLTVSTVDYNPTGHDKITIPQQVLKNIEDAALRKIVRDKYITPALEGVPEENAKFQSYIDAINSGQDATKLESNIDASKLSKSNKIAVLRLNKDTRLWRDIVIDEVLRLKTPDDQLLEELNNEHDYWADTESSTMIKDFLQMQGSGRKMLQSIIGQDYSGLHPDTVQLPGLKDYYATALKRWFFTEIVHPKSDHSWKAVAKPLDPVLQHKLGIKPGEFFYGEANKVLKAEITINGKTIKGQLGKLWDTYGKSNPEAFRFLMERVPMDSRAGARAGMFKGFWGEGSGIYTHPSDDVAMGGADKDIDSYFIHHDMPKEIIDYYESNKNQWKKTINGKEVLIEPKQDPDFLNPDEQVENRIFDPMSALKMNQVAYEGNALLGQLLATGNRLKTAHKEYAKQKFTAFGYDKFDRLVWQAKVNPDIKDIEKFIYDSVNFSADAADGKTLYDAEHLRRVAYSKVYTDIKRYTYDKQGKKYESNTNPFRKQRNPETGEETEWYEFYPTRDPIFRDITDLDQLAKGIKYKDGEPVRLSFDELALQLEKFQRNADRPVDPTNPDIKLPYESIMGEVLNTMSKVDLNNFENTGWLGKHYTKWLEKFDAIFSIPNSKMRTEAVKYLGRYIINNVAKRQGALKKYQATLERIYPGDPDKQKQAFDVFKSDSLRNDMLDYASFFNVVKKGTELENLLKKTTGYTDITAAKEIKDIIRTAEKFRFHIRGVREAMRTGRPYRIKDANGQILPEAYTKQQLDADLTAYYRTLDTGGERISQIRRGYFEHLLIGRAEPRTESLKSMLTEPMNYIRDFAWQQTKDGKPRFPGLKEINPKTFAKDIELNGGTEKEVKQALRLQRLYTDVKAINKRYFQTTNDTFFYNHPIVQDITIAEKAKTFHELTQATFKPVWSDDQSVDIAKLKNDTPIDTEARATGKEVISNDFSSNRNLWTKIFADMKDASINAPLNDRELNDLGDRMFKILDKNSHLRASLPDRYAAWTQQIQGVAKTMDTMTYPELKAFVEHMEEFGNIGKGLELKKRHWWYMNDWLDNLFAKYDENNYITRSMYVQGSAEAFKATLKYPLSRMGKLNAISLAMTTQKDKYLSIDEDEFQNHPITKIADQLPVADWHILDEYTIAFRERYERNDTDAYEKVYQEKLKAFENIKNKKYNISEEGVSRPKTGEEIVQRLQELYTSHVKNKWQKTVANDAAIERYLLPHMYFIEDGQVRNYKDLKNKKVDLSTGIMDIDRVMSLLAGRVLSQGDMPFLGIKGKDLIYHQWLIQNREFNGQKIEGMDSKYKWINLKIAERVKDLNRKLAFEHDVDTPVKDAEGTEYIIKKKDRPFKYLEFNGFDAGLETRFYTYFPHMDIPQATREAALKRELDRANANGDKDGAIAIQLRYKLEYGKDLSEDGLATDDMLNGLENLVTEDTIAGRGVRRTSSLRERDKHEPLMGYNRSWKVFKDYSRSLTAEYWNGMSALVGHYNVDNFIRETKAGKNNVGVENLDPWINFMRTSIRTSLGYPAIFPQEWANDPKFKIKGNPYRVMTEDYWINKATIMDKWFGITPEMRVKYEAMDIANRQMHYVDPWRNVRQAAITRKLSALTNFEAKMSMMSLLFSPKTYLANIGTASINTGISAGWDYWKEAGNIAYLQTINPKWTSMDAITVDIDKLGGIESFIKNEVPLSQKFKAANAQRFLERSLEVLRKDKNTKDITLREIARQEGLSQDFVDKSAYFMRSSERIARRRAWIAHYLKARNLFEASHMSYKWDDPLLIEMANRGVYATQFLYSNAARPQFARTALGKIFSRFQLFTYNSIKWRADLTKQAMAMGYSKNSPEMDRFTRMASADVFVMALATLLPYSIFNNALPPPYNHLQGMAAWLFGDKEDKEKSFFGVLPYPANIIQPILPPSSRYITPIIGMLASGDTERFTQYHVWTWMPFGRFINDTRKSLENPYLLPERSFGIPFNSFRDRFLSKEKQ